MSNYEATQRRRNFAVGIFVLVGLGAFIWLIYIFGDLPVLASKWRSYTIFVQFSEAPGVQESTPVQFCGYQVGRVIEVRPPRILYDENMDAWYHQTEVQIAINKRYDNIPQDVEIKLMRRGLGSSYIVIEERPFDVEEPPGPYLKAGTVLQGSTGVTSEFFPEESQEKLDSLVTSLQDLIMNANDIVGSAENKANIQRTLSNLSEATARATETLEEIKKFSKTGRTTVAEVGSRADEVVVSFVELSEQLSRTSAQMRVLLEKVNEGKGSAGRFVNDGKLYEEMLENSRQIKELVKQIRVFVEQSQESGLPLKLQ
jgi:phospholipid/cholesterol/gamma-HCH transport system substrate-binding protein